MRGVRAAPHGRGVSAGWLDACSVQRATLHEVGCGDNLPKGLWLSSTSVPHAMRVIDCDHRHRLCLYLASTFCPVVGLSRFVIAFFVWMALCMCVGKLLEISGKKWIGPIGIPR